MLFRFPSSHSCSCRLLLLLCCDWPPAQLCACLPHSSAHWLWLAFHTAQLTGCGLPFPAPQVRRLARQIPLDELKRHGGSGDALADMALLKYGR